MDYIFGQDYNIIQTQIQDPAASEMEFFVILVKGFWLSTSISKGSTCGIVGFVYTFGYY